MKSIITVIPIAIGIIIVLICIPFLIIGKLADVISDKTMLITDRIDKWRQL